MSVLFEMIFSSFYTFIGTVILITVILDGIAKIVRAFRKDR